MKRFFFWNLGFYISNTHVFTKFLNSCLYFFLDKVVVCIQCATLFQENDTKTNCRLRNKHTIKTCRALRFVNQRNLGKSCPLHIDHVMLKGNICTLCRPNVKILGLTRQQIQHLKGDTPNYVFLYGVDNSQPYGLTLPDCELNLGPTPQQQHQQQETGD